MARTIVSVLSFDRFGAARATEGTAGDITNGMKISENDGRKFVEIANVSNASSVDVTFDIPKVYDDDLSIVDIIVSVAPGVTKYAGPWKTGIFNQTAGSTDNAIHFDVGSTGVVFRGYRMEP